MTNADGLPVKEWSPDRSSDLRAARAARNSENASAAQGLDDGAAILALSLFADSALEHYRGGFYNPVMYVGPSVSACVIAATATPLPRTRGATGAIAIVAGGVGTGFHLWNILKREGGLSWLNLFYAAPALAPAGVSIAGVLLISADAAREHRMSAGAARLLCGGMAVGLLGTSAEAALFHFRGAFHNKAMYIPVSIPPLSAVVLMGAALKGRSSPLARNLLRATTVVGLLGTFFHARAISREMGGWQNWSQNILAGPPIPAPPSFTGIALAALGALRLMQARR